MTNSKQEPLVLILMGTFNGERFIREQLDSIAAQTHKNWKLVVSDDGSTDQTVKIINSWITAIGGNRVELRCGPKKGFVHNFLSMACDPRLNADYYAFCDQDDVWFEDKLARAIEILKTAGNAQETLYCGRTIYTDENLKIIGTSPLCKRAPRFENALVQSLAGGNTMIFNQLTKSLLDATGTVAHTSHDWWLYQLVSGVRGRVIYDSEPKLFYRQHTGALIGGKTGLKSIVTRLRQLFSNCYRGYHAQNIPALIMARQYLKHRNNEKLESFSSLRNDKLLNRLLVGVRIRLYRQCFLETLIFYCALAIKKV
jgi:glycosyltransferase involved in cell wall biosynthesis